MKLLKKSVSVFLALLMVFGTFSILATAADAEFNWSIDTKFYRFDGTEWVETTKAKKGESVKARVFMETDFALDAAQMFFVYPSEFLTFDPTGYDKGSTSESVESYALVTNNTFGGNIILGEGVSDIAIDDMIYFEQLDPAVLEGKTWIKITEMIPSDKTAVDLDGSDWFFEIDFDVVKEPTGKGQFYMSVECIADYDKYMGLTTVTAKVGNKKYLSCDEPYLGQFAYTTYDRDEDSTLSVDNTVKFITDIGTITGTTEYTGYIGDKLSTIEGFSLPTASAEGKQFLGWSTDGSTVLTEDQIKALEVGYEPLALKAVFRAASATYIQNVYTMDANGDYGAAAKTTPGSTPGTMVNAATYSVPAGFTLDTEKSTSGDVEVTEDDTDVLNIYLKRNQYKATFGETSTDVYYEATYAAPAGPAKKGYAFAGWKAADNSILLEGATATMGLADVAYTATYAPAANTATIVINYVDQVTGEAKKVEKEVPTVTENTIAIVETAGTDAKTTYVTFDQLTPVEHYEFTTVGSTLTATVAADGSTELNVNYVPKKYTATFNGATENETVTNDYYAEITAPNAPAVAGKTFEGWAVVGTENVVVKAGDKVRLEGNIAYTPIYSTNNYAVKYVYGTPAPTDATDPAQWNTEAVMGTAVDTSYAPEAAGWTFDGWTVTGAVEDGDGYKVGEAPVTVTGKWIKNTYTVKFWLDESKTIPYFEVMTYGFGDSVEMPYDPEIIDLTDAGIYGKEFLFWDFDSIDIIDEETQDYFTLVEDGQYVLEFVASLEDIPYTATFTSNDDNVGFTKTTIEELHYGDVITADDIPDTEYEGYTFNYWKINGKEVPEWVDYTVTGNVQIQAFFTANTYNAVFNGNGGYWLDENNEPTIESITLQFQYGQEITAPISNPVRTGWHLDEEMPWDPELGTMEAEDKSIDAVWLPNEYTITFVVEGETFEKVHKFNENNITLADGVADKIANENTKPGYTFKGWTADGGATVVEDITTLKVPAADTTYTAVFVPSEADVGYKVNVYEMDTEGKYPSVPTRVVPGHGKTEETVTYNATLDGFTLDTTLGTLTGVIKGDGSLVLDAYYARNKVKVDINGDVDEYFQGEEIELPDAPKKEGEEFTHWEDENGNQVTDPYVVPNETDKEITLTPVYKAITYTATFYINGTEYAATEADYNTAVKAPAVPGIADLPTGYSFVGWAKTAGATEALADLGNMPAGDVSFYAVLKGNSGIEYNIQKYFMGTDGKTYTLDAEKSETKYDGVAGESKTITPDTYEGFTFDADNENNVLTATVNGDGSTIFVVYYDRNTIKVTINGEEEDMYYGEEITTPENVPEEEIPEGNKQDGWVYENGDPVTFPVKVGTEDIVIEPNFVPADFLMTFANGDVTVQSGNQTFGEKLSVPADQVLVGNIFDGWYDAAGNKVVAGTTTVPSAATTYTAKFTPIDYTVTFYNADGTDVIASGDYAFGTKISTLVPAYTAPEGYTFKGWATVIDGIVVEFTDDVTVPVNGATYFAVVEANSGIKYTIKTFLQNVGGNGYTPQADKEDYGTAGEEIIYVPETKEGFTLDAEQSKLVIDSLAGDGSSMIRVFYNRNTYKVTIDGEENTYYYDEEIKKADPTPEPGYDFDKWVDDEGNTVEFPMNVPAEDVEITPVYTPIKYPVTFKWDFENVYASSNRDFDSVITAPATNPSKPGYTFQGWSTDGKTVITDLGKVVVDGNTFIAVFTANSGIEYTVYKVFRNLDNTDWEEPAAETRTGTAGETIALDKDAEAVEGFIVSQIDPATTELKGDGTTEIYIYYTRNKVSVTIDGEKEDFYFGETIEEPKDTDKEGYDFKGWVDDEGNTVTFPITVPAEDIVITPVYEAQTKSLSFEIDGKVVAGYPTTAKVDSDITAPADPKKDGYSFVGWYVKGTSTAFNGKMPTTDTIYEAKWTAGTNTKYTIEIYMMDTEGKYSLSTATISYGVTGTFAEIVPSTTSGFTYDASRSELSKEIAADGSTVLKIYYARDLYTVTWNVDGLETEEDVYYGAAIVAPADPEKKGYTFAGWDPAVPETMPANDVEFTATWTAATYTITYVVNGAKETETYNYGDTVTVKAAPSIEGMTFNGWFDGNTKYEAGSTFTMDANDLIIVADFSVGVYKVTYRNADGSVFATEMVKFGDPIPVPAEEPTKEYYTFIGWNITYDKMPAEDIVVEPIFERIPVKLIPMAGSTTVIDTDKMAIYGLEEGVREIELRNYFLDVEGDGFFTITPVETGCYGTGTKVTLYDNQAPTVPVETYTIVIFGDVNGDAFVQAIDRTWASEEVQMTSNWSYEEIFDGSAIVANPDYDPYKTMAADLNADGVITATDATIIGDASIGILTIDQTTGNVTHN